MNATKKINRLTDHVDEMTHVCLRKNDMELRGSIILVRVFLFYNFYLKKKNCQIEERVVDQSPDDTNIAKKLFFKMSH